MCRIICPPIMRPQESTAWTGHVFGIPDVERNHMSNNHDLHAHTRSGILT